MLETSRGGITNTLTNDKQKTGYLNARGSPREVNIAGEQHRCKQSGKQEEVKVNTRQTGQITIKKLKQKVKCDK